MTNPLGPEPISFRHGVVKPHEAEQEAERLNREDPERTRFRWVSMSEDNDESWAVLKVARGQGKRRERGANRVTMSS